MKTIGKFLAAFAAMFFAHTGLSGGATFSPTTLPDATVGVYYSQTVTITADANIVDIWSDDLAVSPIPGLSATWDSSKGEFYLNGSPTVPNTYTFKISANVTGTGVVNGTCTLVVKAGGGGTGGGSTVSIKETSPASPVAMASGEKKMFYVMLESSAEVMCMWSKLSKTEGWKTIAGGLYTTATLSCQYEHDGASTQLKAEVYSSDGKKLYGTATWDIASGSGGGTGGGDKVTFSVKNPPTSSDVNLTLGQEQYFEVEASGDTKDYTLNWSLITKISTIPIGTGLTCSFKSSDYGVGEYTVYFNAENTSSGDKANFSWSVKVTSGAVEPSGEIKGASPDPYECSSPAYSKYTMIELADGAVQTFALTVDSNVEPYYYWTVNGAAAAGASTASSSYVYAHSASVNQKRIYCQVYSDSKMEKLLCYAVWVVKETAVPLEIVATPEVSNGMVGIAYGPIQFTEKNGYGVTWNAVSGSLPPGLVFDTTPSSARYGQLYGMSTTVGTYQFTISGMNGTNPVSKDYTVTIVALSAPNIVSSSPDQGMSFTARVGQTTNFSVVTENTTTIDWYVNDVKVYTGEAFAFTPAEVLADTSATVTCKLSNEYCKDYRTRSWVGYVSAALVFETSTDLAAVTGGWIGGDSGGVALSLNNHDTEISSVTLASGTLPDGVAILHSTKRYVYVKGSVRTHGEYNFSLTVTLADGDSATLPVKLTVTGADIDNATWYVDPVNGDNSKSGLGEGNAVRSIVVLNGLIRLGDTVVLKPGDYLGAFNPVSGVNYVADGGQLRFAAGSGDISGINFQNGASIAFVVGGGDWFYDAEISVVAVPVGAKTSDYTVQTTTSDYSISNKYIEDGWLKVKSLWHYDSHGRMIVRFAENGTKECVLEDYTISHAAMFYNDGGENATVRFTGDNQCSLTFCTFLWATNGVDLVLDENAQLWCHQGEKIEGFDTMTFNRGSWLKLDNLPGYITVRDGVRPVFTGTKGSYTLKLTEPMEWGAKRAIIWDYEGQDLDQFTLEVASGETRADYEFQNFGNHLYVVKRELNGGFPNLEEICPAARISSQSPAAYAASSKNPLGLTVGTPATFSVESMYPQVKGFTWMCGVRFELDGVPVPGDFYSGCTITPTNDMVDNVDRDKRHHLRATLVDYYHDSADTADWYFTVSPTPPTVAALPRISAWDGYEFSRDFAEYVTGGYGALHFMRESGSLSDGISLTANGVLTGTMTAALDDEDLAISVMDEWGSVATFTQKLHLKTSENEPPYVVSVNPAADELDYYIGDWITFTALTEDDDTNYYYYRWMLDGANVKSGNLSEFDTKTPYYDFYDYDPAHETEVSTLLLQLRDDSTGDWITAKGWTINKLERPTYAEGGNLGEIPVGTKYRWTEKEHIELTCITELGQNIVSAEVIRGELPDGMELADSMYGAYIIGEARKLGTSMFTVEFTSSNGQKAFANYELTIIGEADTEPRTWTICSWNWWNDHNTEEGYAGTTYREQFDYDGGTDGLLGLAVGDTVNVYGDNELDPFADEKNRLAKDGVAFNFVRGPIKLIRHPNQPLYLMEAAFSNEVTSLDFTLSTTDLPFGETYGEVVQIAEMPTVLYNRLHPTVTSDYFFEGAPYLDEHRVFSVKILGHLGQRIIYDNNGDAIYFADDSSRRDAIMEDRSRSDRILYLANAGVLPSSLTLKGDISYRLVGLSYYPPYPNHDTKVIFDSDLNLSIIGGDDDMPFMVGGDIEVRPGVTINISPNLLARANLEYNHVSYAVYSSGSVLFSDGCSGEGKVKVVLPGALGEKRRVGVVYGYYDDRDPNEVFEAVLPNWVENKEDYHFEMEKDPNIVVPVVYLQNYTESEEFHGETVWNEPSSLGTTNLGAVFTHTFTNSTLGAEGYASSFSSVGQPFETSESSVCTFNPECGTRELELVPYISDGGTTCLDAVDLGFPFPIEDAYVMFVRVRPDGMILFNRGAVNTDYWRSFKVLDGSVLSGLTQAFNHVYISRGEGTFTVRWGLFAMATLHQDGRIVVAYGPLADAGRKAGEATCPTVYRVANTDVRNAEFTRRSGLYSGKGDAVFTPTEYVSTATIGSSSGKLTHTPKRPGTYKAKVLYHAYTNDVEACRWTREFSWTVTGDEPEFPVVTSFTSSKEPTDDGIIHIYEGESMPTFTAEVAAPAQLYIGNGNIGSNSSGSKKQYTITYTLDRKENLRGTTAERLSMGLYAVTLKAHIDDIYTYRRFLLVNNQTFHVNAATTEEPAYRRDGSAEHPWKDFPYGIGSDYYLEPKRPRFVFGDSIVVHPGTYHNPILLSDSVGSVIITNAPGGSAANTELVMDVNPDSNYYTRFGWRAFEESAWSLVELTNGWQYVRVPTQNAIVSGLAIRDSKIWGDMLKPVSLHGVAGGGAFGGSFVNCVFEDCVATNSYSYVGLTAENGYGGAAYGANLINCLIVGCEADIGGAASNCKLYNCTIADNAARIAAGGIDGECKARNSIIRYNTCNGEESDYASTYRPARLVPDVPELTSCFTAGDPLFCDDYSLFAGSPCIGSGNVDVYPYPSVFGELSAVDILGRPRFTAGRISLGAFEGEGTSKVTLKVETVGVGTVEPGTLSVVVGSTQTFTAESDRGVVGWYTNGVLAASSGNTFTWEAIPPVCSLKVVFDARTLTVGEVPGHDYETIDEAIAAAGSGDTITVAAGTYGPIDLSDFAGALEIRAESYVDDAATWGAVGDVIIDGGGTARCITARMGDDSLVFSGLLLTNGYVNTTTAYNGPGGGGGIRGGKAVRCTITDCRAYLCGGGAYNATLERCLVTGNVAFKNANKEKSCGGGAYGGTLYDCRVTGNSIDSWFLNGGGTYDAIVKNSFVWGNSAGSSMTSNAEDGEAGASLYVVEKVPTEQRVAAQPAQMKEPGWKGEYATWAEAATAQGTTGIDVADAIIAGGVNAQDYINRFEVTMTEKSGGYVTEIVLKEEEVAKMQDQIADAIVVDDNGNDVTVFNVQKMERTLTNTTPGFYYALEFASDLGAGSFFGERHLATGSGSLKLSATSQDTSSGFWRMAIYLTPDGEERGV